MMAFAGASVVFRVDASLQIGTGHVMRCLTLAAALKRQGASCQFVCRAHEGHLLDHIARQGYDVSHLPLRQGMAVSDGTAHGDWLGCAWATDAAQTIAALGGRSVDWLIVDHYALDARWEEMIAPHAVHILAIDDLADRLHACELLLDQNLGRHEADYAGRVPSDCRVLAGPRFALLRPEFAELRQYSLRRRQVPALHRLLITMGGIDAPNATSTVLRALQTMGKDELPSECQISVVMGAAAPWLGSVREEANRMSWPTEVLVGIGDMAQCMADSDLAIGAAGSTAWERCCLGLPSLMVVLADNQREAARHLRDRGAAKCLDLDDELENGLRSFLRSASKQSAILSCMSEEAREITDGKGCNLVACEMRRLTVQSH